MVIIICNSSNLMTDFILKPVINSRFSHHSSSVFIVFEDTHLTDMTFDFTASLKTNPCTQPHARFIFCCCCFPQHLIPSVICAFCCLSLLFFLSVISSPSLWGWWIFRSPPFLSHNFTDGCINRLIKIFDFFCAFLGGSAITSWGRLCIFTRHCYWSLNQALFLDFFPIMMFYFSALGCSLLLTFTGNASWMGKLISISLHCIFIPLL